MYSSGCVLFLLVVCVSSAFAAPGYIGDYAPAVSHVSRFDIHNSKPLVTAYQAPIGIHAPVAVPIGHSYGHYGIPAAHSYSNRVDIHSPSYVRPILGHGPEYGYGYGHGYGGYGLHDGSGYGYAVHGYGVQGLHHGY